jgi:hypothetical protein
MGSRAEWVLVCRFDKAGSQFTVNPQRRPKSRHGAVALETDQQIRRKLAISY